MTSPKPGMRILVVSNLYPPHYLGGYELGCEEAVQGLEQHGHRVRTLTSTYGVGTRQFDGKVYRWLESDFGHPEQRLGRRAVRLLRKEIRNQGAFKRIVKDFRPDLIYFWNLRGLSISLAFSAQRLGIPTCFYVFDKWLETWWQDLWYALWPPAPRRFVVKLASRLTRAFLSGVGLLTTDKLDLSHVQFASFFLQRAALQARDPVASGEVIHWGIRIDEFPYQDKKNVKQLLFVGQLGRHKGVHTAIEALGILVNDYARTDLHLTIAGSGPDHEYYEELNRLVDARGLTARVKFTGFVARDKLPDIYRTHEVLLFPSVWDEPFGLGLLEGMASGLAVVGTASGGSAEILMHDVTGLVFPREDAAGCAEQILRAINDPGLVVHVRRNARQMVEEKFTLHRTIDNIERSLLSQLDGS